MTAEGDVTGWVDRREFCEKVEISEWTLTVWIGQKLIVPNRRQRGQYWAQFFSPGDLLFGRQLTALMRRRPGEFTRKEAAAIVRGEMELPPPGHAPGSSLGR